jgi:cysteine desulfurase
MRIYLDNAATTPMHPDVIKEMLSVMSEDYGNPSSIHRHGRTTKAIIEQARKTVARTINASIGDVFFTGSATEANNTIIKNAVQDLGVTRIISSPTEHPCVLEAIDFVSISKKTKVQWVDIDKEGNIDLGHLERLLAEENSGVTLVSIMHGNNEIGTMSDIMAIGQLCRTYYSLFHCDAVQTIGKYHIDVQSSGIHFLSGSAHKFHGPKGVGFMFVDSSHILTPYIHGGAQERNMRAGTENVAGISGCAKAIEIASANMDKTRDYIMTLRTHLKNRLSSEINDVQYNGNQDVNYMAHVLSVSFPSGPKADMLVMNLDIAGISASSASACSAGIEEDSHVMKAIDHPAERKTIRFSFSIFNTIAELDYLIERIKGMM